MDAIYYTFIQVAIGSNAKRQEEALKEAWR